jgi:regulator of sigma E protease
MMRYERPVFLSQPAQIGYVDPGSPADRAGVREDDTITAIDGNPTPNWEAVILKEIAAANSTVEVTVERAGELRTFAVAIGADKQTGVGYAGWFEPAQIKLGEIAAGKPADIAGLKTGDYLLAINGIPINSDQEVSNLIQRFGGQKLDIEIRRDAEEMVLQVTPEQRDSENNEKRWWIGIGFSRNHERVEANLSFPEALRESVDLNIKNATLIFKFLGGLLEQRMSPKSLEGPIGIARLSGEAARRGWPELIGLMAAISLNLGIFNLLPIPILDGGVIVLLLVESLIQRDVSVAVKERIVQVGFVFLMLLFVFVIYNDIMKSLASG